MNEPIAARVMKPTYSRRQLLKNLENSRLARESLRFDDYLRREYRLKGRYFAERTTISNGKIGYLSSDYFEGQQIPVRSRAFVDEAGHIKWPNVDGFMVDNLGNPITEQVTLKAGQIIDRYGSSSGRFTSPIENGVTLPFNKRGLPYPEGYQDYHKYELVMDLTKKNIVNAYYQSEEIIRKQISVEMKKWNLSFDDLANIQKGEIAKVFGQGGGIQIKFPTGVGIYKKMGLLKEINEMDNTNILNWKKDIEEVIKNRGFESLHYVLFDEEKRLPWAFHLYQKNGKFYVEGRDERSYIIGHSREYRKFDDAKHELLKKLELVIESNRLKKQLGEPTEYPSPLWNE
ncbi:Imm59 family immunity protein [Streptococcus equi]|uniref:Imm59 family immunity protein n=1 Tax=Streptococcus equi TaxID=1336 RepID=UPI002F923345